MYSVLAVVIKSVTLGRYWIVSWEAICSKVLLSNLLKIHR